MMKTHFILVPVLMILASCGKWYGEEETRLPGERISIRDTQAVTPSASFADGASLPRTILNNSWMEENMSPSHEGFHLSLSQNLKEVWRTDVGDIKTSDALVTNAPVASDTTLYFLNVEGEIVAINLSDGQKKWSVSVVPENEDSDSSFGGGLSLSDKTLFASTGYGEVMALSPDNGEILWRTRTTAPVRAAPTVYKNKVMIVARDNTATAYDATSGKQVWDVIGATTGAAFLGGSSAAAAGQIAVLPFASGEILAVDINTGRRGWAQVLSGGQRGAALSTINDISSDPILHKGKVFVANQSGQLSAFDAGTGKSLWTQRIGAYNPGWITGDSLYIVTSDARLMRILTESGDTVWETNLPFYADEEDKEGVITYAGPIVANNRVYLSSLKAGLQVFDAKNGDVLETLLPKKQISIPPIVVNQTLFVIDADGTLYAFR